MNKEDKLSIGIALIHKKDVKRLNMIQPKIFELCDVLKNFFVIENIEISQQPEVIPISIFKAIIREIKLCRIERKWCKYREKKENYFVFLLKDFIRILIIFKKKKRRIGFIEEILTDKHINAWKKLIPRNDFVLIFEDDAVFKENTLEKIKNIFLNVLPKDNNDYVYFDIGGGFEYDKLKIDKLNISQYGDCYYYKKIVINTTCAYIINRKLALFFIDYIIKNPVIRIIPIDFLINAISMQLKSANIYCAHYFPSVLKH